jgi:hypothetical protein
VETANMARKKWQAKTEITPSLLKFREKRKWQINFRRYVLEKSPCPFYAPYFGLDIENIRKWFEYQFTEGLSWENFAKNWQFDHIIPVTYFDHENEKDLHLCWNFTNLRVEPLLLNKNPGNRVDVLGAKSYFDELFTKTGYQIAKDLRDRITQIELSELMSSEPQQKFLSTHKEYLGHIENYSAFEFELLNHGRSLEEIEKEMDFLKKNTQS